MGKFKNSDIQFRIIERDIVLDVDDLDVVTRFCHWQVVVVQVLGLTLLT